MLGDTLLYELERRRAAQAALFDAAKYIPMSLPALYELDELVNGRASFEDIIDVLRHLDPRARPELAAAAPPELQFNYLGRYSGGGTGGDWAAPPGIPPLTGGRGEDMPAGYPLVVDVLAVDADGRSELHASWEWPAALFGGGEVPQLAELWFEALRGIVRAARGGCRT